MDELSRILGVLGAYFAILLVLAVSVETMLEPFTLIFKGLRKRISPDDVMQDINEWLPKYSDQSGAAKAAAIANLTTEYDVKAEDLESRINEIDKIANETAQALGVKGPMDDAKKMLAVRMAVIRIKYGFDERRRIVIIRALTAVIGIFIAILLHIDTFDILADLFPADVRVLFATPVAQYGGMVITGFAASAGSSFWHDQLGRIRAIKDAARRLEEVVKPRP